MPMSSMPPFTLSAFLELSNQLTELRDTHPLGWEIQVLELRNTKQSFLSLEVRLYASWNGFELAGTYVNHGEQGLWGWVANGKHVKPQASTPVGALTPFVELARERAKKVLAAMPEGDND